jgi:hypothetical protein
MGEFIAVAVVAVVIYGVFHGHHVHRNYYRHGLSFWVSMRGPFGTRISKRL